MERVAAIGIVLAALLLLFPSTNAVAGTSIISQSGILVISSSDDLGLHPLGTGSGGGGDEDKGDADDLAGRKQPYAPAGVNGVTNSDPSSRGWSPIGKYWWMHLFVPWL